MSGWGGGWGGARCHEMRNNLRNMRDEADREEDAGAHSLPMHLAQLKTS